MNQGTEQGSVQAAGYGPPGGGPPGGYGPPGGGPPGYGPPGGGAPPGGYGPPGGGGYGPPPGGGYGPPQGGGFGPPPGGFGPPGGPPGMMMMGGQPKFSPLAIIAMITGILSIPTCFCSCFAPGLNSPLAIAGLVCGILAMNKIKAEPNMWRGTGMAITGIVTGALGILLVLLAAFTTLDESIRSSSGL